MENGAPGTIRTSDPQIRSLDPFIDPTSFPCKPGTKESLTLQGVKTPTANQFDLIPAAPATPIAAELHAHFAAGGTVAEGMRLVELLERGAQMAKRRNEATGRGTRLPRTSNRPLPKSLSPSHWRPAPAELRRIALMEKWQVQYRAQTMRKLLAAEPLIEFSDDHRAAMRARLATIIPSTARTG